MPPWADPPVRPTAPVTTDFKYVRKVKGRKWQARVWLPEDEGGHLNLGLYETDREAGEAVRAYLRSGFVRPDLLPKWVRAGPAGGFVADYRPAPGRLVRLGPYPTPDLAHAAMRRYLARHRVSSAERKRAWRRRRAIRRHELIREGAT